MNGRVYDYNLGRFLSVDPFIQDPGNSQSLNPYSYIMNNPLAGTDPTGYVSETVEMKDDDKLVTMDDGNTYLDQGGDSLIKVDTVTATSSNGSSTTVNMGSSGSTSDIGSQNNVAQNDSQSSQSFGDGLKSGIQSQASNMARKTGQELDEDEQGDGVTARLGEIEQDESGVVTQASIICGRSCQSQAGLYTYEHSISLIRQRNMEDPTMMALRVMHGYSDRITNNNVTRLMSISPNPLAQEISAGIGVYRLLVHQDLGGYGGTAASGVAAQRAEQISGSKKAGGKVGAATSLAYEILKEFN
jgi:hypothetical protein